MCELLVKAVDATHPDITIDSQSCYKRGDVVSIQPDGYTWGKAELDTNMFIIVKKPGVPVSTMMYLLNDSKHPIKNTAALKIPVLRKVIQNKERKTKTRNRYKIDLTTEQILDKERL